MCQPSWPSWPMGSPFSRGLPELLTGLPEHWQEVSSLDSLPASHSSLISREPCSSSQAGSRAVLARPWCTPRPLFWARPGLHLRLPRPGRHICRNHEAARYARSLLAMLDTACSATLFKLRPLLKYLQARRLLVRCHPKLQPRKAPCYSTYLETNLKEYWPRSAAFEDAQWYFASADILLPVR